MISPGGKTLALACEGHVQLWDVESLTVLATLDAYETPQGEYTMAFSPNGDKFLVAYEEEPMKAFSLRLWDLTGELNKKFTGHDHPIRAVAFSADGSTLASGSWVDMKLWDVRTGDRIRTLNGYTDVVNSLAFSPGRTRLASAGGDGAIRLWDVTTGDEIITLHGHGNSSVNCVTFSSTGRTLASADVNGTVKLWRAGGAE